MTMRDIDCGTGQQASGRTRTTRIPASKTSRMSAKEETSLIVASSLGFLGKTCSACFLADLRGMLPDIALRGGTMQSRRGHSMLTFLLFSFSEKLQCATTACWGCPFNE